MKLVVDETAVSEESDKENDDGQDCELEDLRTTVHTVEDENDNQFSSVHVEEEEVKETENDKSETNEKVEEIPNELQVVSVEEEEVDDEDTGKYFADLKCSKYVFTMFGGPKLILLVTI